MKVLDVGPFEEGLQKNMTMLSRLEGEMKTIETAVGALVALDDSLKGQGGNAIRAFYNDCHMPFLQFFATFNTAYDSVLTQMKSALNTLEPASNGFIQESFLDADVKDGLTTIDDLTLTMTDEANAVMDEVSDIVALPHLDDSEVHEGVSSAQTKREKTTTDLNEFDATQAIALTPIEADLLRMELWLLEIEGMMNSGLTDIDFPADQWAEKTVNQPLKTELDHRVDVMNGVVEDSSEDETGEVSTTYANGYVMLLKDAVGLAKKANSTITGGLTSFGMYVAGKDGGLSTSKHYNPQTGKYSYRINATKTALDGLKVNPDAQALKELMARLPKKNKKWSPKHFDIAATNQTMLKFATQKKGQSGWSGTGDSVLKKHPSLAYWNDQATFKQQAKTIGVATVKGAGKSFTDIVDLKGIAGNGIVKGAAKSLAPLGAGLSYYSNFSTAKDAGLDDAAATGRAAVDTAIDVAVGGAVQVGLTAAGTALIPIPGVGTAVGIAAGIAVNSLLNVKFGDDDKSAMDHIKGWFH